MKHGQTGRLIFNVTAAEGTDTTLMGAVLAAGRSVPMEQDEADGLLVPALPPGVYLMEVRCGGACVLYGELEVLRSPLGLEAGAVAWSVDVDLSEPLAVVNVTLNEGPRGPKGEKGEKGEAPDNVVTTDTEQTISGAKTFSGFAKFNKMQAADFISETCLIGMGLDTGYVEVVNSNDATDLQITYRPNSFTATDSSVLTRAENDERYAPAGHVDDAVVHVTAAERATLVKMIEVDSADDIPTEGETCNARHCYCVRRDAVAAVAATGSIVIGEDAPLSEEIIRINGVEMTIPEQSDLFLPLKAKEMASIINSSGCGVTATVESCVADRGTINLTANEAGSAGNGIAVEMIDYRGIGDVFSNDIKTWTPMLSGGVDGVEGGVDMYVWGIAGWVQVNVDKLGELPGHTDDAVKHVTAEERTRWNGKADGNGIGMFIVTIESAENAPGAMDNMAYNDGAVFAMWLPSWDMYGQLPDEAMSRLLVIGLSEPGAAMNGYATSCGMTWSWNKIA